MLPVRRPVSAPVIGLGSRSTWRAQTVALHHFPVFGMDFQGSLAGSGEPFCNNSIEWRSGERTNAIMPSRGGRLMVIPAFISFSQVA